MVLWVFLGDTQLSCVNSMILYFGAIPVSVLETANVACPAVKKVLKADVS